MLLQGRLRWALILLAAFAGPALAQAPLPEGVQLHRDLSLRDVGERISPAPRPAGGGAAVVWSRDFAMPGARYLRLQFDQITLPEGSNVELRFTAEPAGTTVAVVPGAQLAGRHRYTTGLLPSQGLRASLVASALPQGLSLRLARLGVAVQSKALRPESAVAQGDQVAALPPGELAHRLAEAVALLHIGPEGVACTGVLVDATTVLTNHHCIDQSLEFREAGSPNPGPCGDVLAEFDYLTADQRGATAACEQVLDADAIRDVAWLSLRPPPSRAGTPRTPIPIDGTAAAGARVTLLEHPVGQPMWAVECRVRASAAGTLQHDCWTERGSSGSPLLDPGGTLVGLHFRGAYPVQWTGEQREADFAANGPRYNQARQAGALGPRP